MDSVALNVFVQAAETRSFVAAGRTLGISASGVGKSVTRLEQDLGVRLFHRSTRSVTLTAEGKMFFERARRILAEFDAAHAELSEAAALPKGRLRIGLPMIGEPFPSTTEPRSVLACQYIFLCPLSPSTSAVGADPESKLDNTSRPK